MTYAGARRILDADSRLLVDKGWMGADDQHRFYAGDMAEVLGSSPPAA